MCLGGVFLGGFVVGLLFFCVFFGVCVVVFWVFFGGVYLAHSGQAVIAHWVVCLGQKVSS